MLCVLQILVGLLFAAPSLFACTSFQVKAQDGTVLYCRSMEYGFPLHSEILIVPRGLRYGGTVPEGESGLKWKVRYGFIGMNQSIARHLVNDGMNEKGLVVGALYLPGFAKYEPLQSSQYDRTLAAWELPTYLLSTCATLQEVKATLPTILVAQESLKGFFFPLHFIVSDSTGTSIVIEYINGERRVYDNPLGVLTNSPPFDWQMENLATYINLTPTNIVDLQLKDFKVHFAGQGSGLLGLPGDYSARSRFVRAALFSSFATQPKTAIAAVKLAFHLLNTFDIPEGIVRPSEQTLIPSGQRHFELTQWTIVHDQKNKRTYVRTYENLTIQMVDLKKLDFTEESLRTIPLRKELSIEDITDNSRPLSISFAFSES